MDKIKQVVNQFSRVLLAIAAKSANPGPKRPLEVVRGRPALIVTPHFLDKGAESLGKLSLHAKRIVFILLLQVVAHEEVLCQLWSVRHALDTRVHETSVAQVLQSTKASCSTLGYKRAEIFRHQLFHREKTLGSLSHFRHLGGDRILRLFFVAVNLREDVFAIFLSFHQKHVFVDKVQIIDVKLFLLFCVRDW